MIVPINFKSICKVYAELDLNNYLNAKEAKLKIPKNFLNIYSK